VRDGVPQPLTVEDAVQYVTGLSGRGDGVASAVPDRATGAVRGSRPGSRVAGGPARPGTSPAARAGTVPLTQNGAP
jgi:hypothetical protein